MHAATAGMVTCCEPGCCQPAAAEVPVSPAGDRAEFCTDHARARARLVCQCGAVSPHPRYIFCVGCGATRGRR